MKPRTERKIMEVALAMTLACGVTTFATLLALMLVAIVNYLFGATP